MAIAMPLAFYGLLRMVQVSLGYAVSGTFLGLAYFDLFYNLLAIAVIANLFVDERYRRAGVPELVGVSRRRSMRGRLAAPARAPLA